MADAPIIPNEVVTAHEPPGSMALVGYSDRDNFVRNMVTILLGGATGYWWVPDTEPLPPVPVTPSIAGSPPVLTLDLIKVHCHIELDQTDEDALLQQYEMAARLKVQNDIDKDIDAGCGENLKQAMLLLIAHWYRNREALVEGRWLAAPLAYESLISTERGYEGRY